MSPQFDPIRPERRLHSDDNAVQTSEDTHDTLDLGGWEDIERARNDLGGRAVLGWFLALMSIAWTGFASWSAGRELSADTLTITDIAPWIAILAGPLVLLAIAWLMFGRTRRKEAERFINTVKIMREETAALQNQLGALTARIDESRSSLTTIAGELDGMADASVERMTNATHTIEGSISRMGEQGAAFDASAASAKADMEKLLADLPTAQHQADTLGASLRSAGDDAASRAEALGVLLDRLGTASETARGQIEEATGQLSARLGDIEGVGKSSSATIANARGQVDQLLNTSAEALSEIRSGIDTQAAAVAALVAQAQSGISRSGSDAAEQLGRSIADADSKLEGFSQRLAEQDEVTRNIVARVNDGIAQLDSQFATLAASGDERAAAMHAAIANVREQLSALDSDAIGQDDRLSSMGERTSHLRDQLAALSQELSETIGLSLDEAGTKADRLAETAAKLAPTVTAMREESETAEMCLATAADAIDTSHQRLGELMEGIDGGVGLAEARMNELKAALSEMTGEAQALTAETAPALVEALIQVRDAASRAGERAREAIREAIPQSASEMGDATRKALEAAVQSSVAEQLAELDRVATQAVEAARGASDKLNAQMLSIGQTAGALEAYMNEVAEDERVGQSEEFTRRTAYLMESMHSAAIDVEKILSNEVDEKSWAAYLKGERGVFTRKAVKLLSNSDAKSLGQYYEADPEFACAVNRYVQDFEAMLRRMMSERDGDVMAVAMLSSDMGKLYAALSQAVSRKV
ncbi:coiled-coil domain-containing protein [Sphingomicrobium marinum]|uniref:hypothetical protein n=1 Tax=Sphingomicrobium marinum TaxID=1227950 RepID=UPI00223ED4E0|nr:hypothetical protein [Sphingomicrobium marinum]